MYLSMNGVHAMGAGKNEFEISLEDTNVSCSGTLDNVTVEVGPDGLGFDLKLGDSVIGRMSLRTTSKIQYQHFKNREELEKRLSESAAFCHELSLPVGSASFPLPDHLISWLKSQDKVGYRAVYDHRYH